MQRGLLWLTGMCVLAVPALMSVTSCGSSTIATSCAGQCAPPYELQVNFRAGTTHATAQKVLTSCAGHNPVVIRVGTLHELGGDVGSTATIYTNVFGDTGQASGLLKCLRSGAAEAAWPA